MNQTSPTHEEISARAHTIWEKTGRPEGQELDHWLLAERELRTEQEQANRVQSQLAPSEQTATVGARKSRGSASPFKRAGNGGSKGGTSRSAGGSR